MHRISGAAVVPSACSLSCLASVCCSCSAFVVAPRINGELLKLGIEVSQATVGRYLPRRPEVPFATWRSFLHNHIHDTAAVDMFVGALSTNVWSSRGRTAGSSTTNHQPGLSSANRFLGRIAFLSSDNGRK